MAKSNPGNRQEERLRILTFASLFPSSIDPTHGIFIYRRSLHLSRRGGLEVKVVAPVPYFPQFLRFGRWGRMASTPGEEEIGGLDVHHPRYFLIPNVSMAWHAFSIFLCCLRKIAGLNRSWKIDCIDSHFVYPDGMAAVLLGRWFQIPVIVSARGTDVNVYPRYRLVRQQIRWTLARANAVIAVSSALKQALVDLGVGEDKIRVIPNGVDAQLFRPVPRDQALQSLGLANKGPIIVSVGSLIPAKGHDLLIHAVRRLVSRHPGLRLYILGDGPQKHRLKRQIRGLRLDEAVRLVGKRPNDELAHWFSAATVSCLLSAREGWPNVVTESLACGTPVVATRVGGIPEIIDSPDLGILVNRTVEEAAAGLNDALDRQWDRDLISQEIRTRTWDDVAREVEEVIRSVSKNHREEPTRHTASRF